jgi:hypothetical protein
MQSLTYLLCLATSVACAALLVRSYLSTRTRLLLWSALCFVLLAANNLLLVLDVMVFPKIDLSPLRQMMSLSAVGVLLIGFVWDAD